MSIIFFIVLIGYVMGYLIAIGIEHGLIEAGIVEDSPSLAPVIWPITIIFLLLCLIASMIIRGGAFITELGYLITKGDD
jgi:hypothetical protein